MPAFFLPKMRWQTPPHPPITERSEHEMPCPHNEISIVQRSQQQSAIAAAAYQSGEKLFCEYDQQVKHTTRKSVVSSTMKSCSRQTLPWSTQTATPSGTLPKLLRSNGTPSLQGGGCFPFPERYRPTSTPPLYGISAASSLFPKECAWILPSMTKGTETHTPMSC